MLICFPPKLLPSNIKILNIEQKKCIKYLGIYMDEHLTWKSQITHVNSQISKNLGIFYKLRNYLNVKTIVLYPHLSILKLWIYELG